MNTRKIVFTRPGCVELATVDEPAPLVSSPTEVVLRNRFSLVSAGTELACLSGGESWFALPATPGYIAVGEVLERGAANTHLSPGDLVFTWGPHAEHYKIDTTNRYGGLCLRLPAGLSPALACFTRMASIAMTSLRVSHIELGDVVLVTGLGQVGNFAAQLATLQGGTVIGVDLSARRREAALACGIAHAIDSGAPDWKDEVRRLAGPRGVTTHIEATGLSAVAAEAIGLLAMHGETIQLGSPRAPHQADLTGFLQRVHLPPFTEARGALEWRLPTFATEFTKHSMERNSTLIMELLASGRLKAAPLHTHTLAPSRAPEAYAGLRDRKDDYVGVVFDWSLL